MSEKLRLDLDELAIESFGTGDGEERGSVVAHEYTLGISCRNSCFTDCETC
ncbi:MAG TPA: hypothetical protein VFJ82_10550 [Longimicrobium sp.]|nr:hypothetical protein [Longimicrobium sp.]